MQFPVLARSLLLVIALAVAAFAGWSAVRARSAPTVSGAVAVGGVGIRHAELAAGPDRAIERRWLDGEARARGLRPRRGLVALRGQVADAIAGPGPVPAARALARRFGAFHGRWRARTRCGPAVRDPHADRCGDVAPAPTVACRWLGAATLCGLVDGTWLLVAPAGQGRVGRFRARGAALRAARDRYVRDRAARARESAIASAEDGARDRAERRATAWRAEVGRRAGVARGAADARAEARRRARQNERDPRLSTAALAAGRLACARQATASEPYLFAFGLQDVAGQVEG
ncbi:MAG TPA: hypothetical protein VD836_03390, partial [Solirubrobacteraceae bacterium]|nr:hypothetical protein [Solirubrobacteraceae bacterium]